MTGHHTGFDRNTDARAQATQFLERLNEQEPSIRAFTDEPERDARIERDTNRLAAVRNGGAAMPLYGIPVGVKDLFHVDGLSTRAGTDIPPAVLTEPEGSFIQKLRASGAWIAGKTTTEALAYAGPFPTRNPHNQSHTPGGSSAGSAAAVASGMVPLAIGTQTMRSVIAPASFCGVVGFKPSFGRVPLDGVIQLAHSWDTIGMFTKTTSAMIEAVETLIPNWRPHLPVRKPILGIPEGIYMTLMYEKTKLAFAAAVERLKEAGYTVKSVQMPWEDAFIYGDDMLRFVQGELAETHAQWLPDWLDYCGDAVRQGYEAGCAVDPELLHRYREVQLKLRYDLIDVGIEEGVDIWISPAQAGSAPELGGPTGWSGMTAIWSYAGSPAITLPVMKVNGMPLGLQCVGAYGSDEALIIHAAAIEKVLEPKRT